MADTGYHWPALAQQAFMAGTCRAGLSIGEWCASAHDQCCGVICPNAPITGPATIIVFTAGTFFNLLFVLIWKSEAPYNLMVQLLATDGALAGLAVRTSTEQFRLSYIHAYLVPLAIMSVVPVAIAASTVEIEYLHGISYDGITALNAARFVSKHLAETAARPPLGDRAKSAPTTQLERLHVGYTGHRSKAHVPVEDRVVRDDELQSKAMLPMVASIIFLVHVVAWIALFIYVYAGFDKPSQAICSGELPIRQYKIVLASTVTAFLVIALGFWCSLIGGLTIERRKQGSKMAYRKDSLEYLASLTHSRRLMNMVAPTGSGWSKPRERVRFGLCFLIYVVWLGCYVTIYITLLQKFLLLGDNPFDWGQVAALGGVFVPALVIARAVFDNLDGWTRGPGTAISATQVAALKGRLVGRQGLLADLAVKPPVAKPPASKRDAPPALQLPERVNAPLDIDFSRVGSASRGSSFRSTMRRGRKSARHERQDGVEEDIVDDGGPGPSDQRTGRRSSRRDKPLPPSPTYYPSDEDPALTALPPFPKRHYDYPAEDDPSLTALPPFPSSSSRKTGRLPRRSSRRQRRREVDEEGDDPAHRYEEREGAQGGEGSDRREGKKPERRTTT